MEKSKKPLATLHDTMYNTENIEGVYKVKITATQYYRLNSLQLEPTAENLQLADIVFDKKRSLQYLKQLIELRGLMRSFGINSKKDLECLLADFEKSKKGLTSAFGEN